MKRQLTEILRKACLKEEEIKIYLYLLKFSRASVAQVQEATNLSYIMVYRTLRSLVERRLIKENQINKKQSLYTALSLQALINELEKQERKIVKLKNSIENLDPLLSFMDLDSDEDEIIIREGLDAMKEEYLKIPRIADEEILALGSVCNFWELVDWDLDVPEERTFIRQRMGKGVYARVLHENQDGVDEIIRRDLQDKRSTKIRENLPISENAVVITEKDVRLFLCDKENPRIIVMNQPELKKVYRSFFANLWV